MAGSSLINCVVYVLLKVILESTFCNPIINLFLMVKIENNSKFLLKNFNSVSLWSIALLTKVLGEWINKNSILNAYFSRLFFFFLYPLLPFTYTFPWKQMFSFLRVKKMWFVCLYFKDMWQFICYSYVFTWHYVQQLGI